MARRKKSRGRRKKSMFKMAKGGVYAAAIALPIYGAYEQTGGGKEGAVATAKAMAFVGPDGKFSFAHGAQIWTPVVALTVVDLVTSKIGLQKKIASALNGLF